MNREKREKGVWPGNLYASYLWLADGLWDDMCALVETYNASENDEVRMAIARHVLIDLDSLDDLIREFHGHIRKEEVNKLKAADKERLEKAFGEYFRRAQPYKSSLKDVRNHLGAHRDGILKRMKKAGSLAWGEWEQWLVQLENNCVLSKWNGVFGAIRDLIETLTHFNLDQWFSVSEGGHLGFHLPLMPPGYYPSAGTKARQD